VFSRFWWWREAAVWDRVFSTVQQEADAAGEVDWGIHFVSGSVIRPHQHAADAKGGSLRPKRCGAAPHSLPQAA
jgi:hypothetical protein